MSAKLKKHTAPDGGWCDRNYWKERADERAAELAAKDAELARLRGVVEHYCVEGSCEVSFEVAFPKCAKPIMWKDWMRGHYYYWCDDHKPKNAEPLLANQALASLPSPAEAGEKACVHPSFNDDYCDSCGAPAAPSDAKAGEL
jgi:hypothetical protein